MTKDAIIAEILTWPTEQRLALADALWSSLTGESDGGATPSDAQKSELERRLAQHDADPARGVPWEDVKREIEGAYGISFDD